MSTKILDRVDSHVASLRTARCQWAIELFKKGHANDWSPFQMEQQMAEDAKQWRAKDSLTENERLMVKRALGLFAAGESCVATSVEKIESQYITDGAARQYLMRKQFEEGLHNFTVFVCLNTYGLDEEECVLAYRNNPQIAAKERYMAAAINSVTENKNFDISTIEGKQAFTKVMATFYLIVEGSWFFTNFVAILSMGKRGKLKGLSKQIDYTIRDETGHVEFGCKILKQIRADYPEIFTPEFEAELKQHLLDGIKLEEEYVMSILPNGILGVDADMLIEFCKYQANNIFSDAGIKVKFSGVSNPFPWLTEVNDSATRSNFFESHSTEYQNKASLDQTEWDNI